MTPMCHYQTGKVIGWAAGTVSCDGSVVTVTYIATNGTVIGTTKPETWEYCRPGFAQGTVYNVVVITAEDYGLLDPPDPNTLYLIDG